MKEKLERNYFFLIGLRKDERGVDILSYAATLVNSMPLLVNVFHSPNAINLQL
mgnify:CR=1 FL=1